MYGIVNDANIEKAFKKEGNSGRFVHKCTQYPKV